VTGVACGAENAYPSVMDMPERSVLVGFSISDLVAAYSDRT